MIKLREKIYDYCRESGEEVHLQNDYPGDFYLTVPGRTDKSKLAKDGSTIRRAPKARNPKSVARKSGIIKTKPRPKFISAALKRSVEDEYDQFGNEIGGPSNRSGSIIKPDEDAARDYLAHLEEHPGSEIEEDDATIGKGKGRAETNDDEEIEIKDEEIGSEDEMDIN